MKHTEEHMYKEPLYKHVEAFKELLNRENYPGAFDSAYQRWHTEHIHCSGAQALVKLPHMVRELRTCNNTVEFTMICAFLATDYATAHMTLHYILYELVLPEEGGE